MQFVPAEAPLHDGIPLYPPTLALKIQKRVLHYDGFVAEFAYEFPRYIYVHRVGV